MKQHRNHNISNTRMTNRHPPFSSSDKIITECPLSSSTNYHRICESLQLFAKIMLIWPNIIEINSYVAIGLKLNKS